MWLFWKAKYFLQFMLKNREVTASYIHFETLRYTLYAYFGGYMAQNKQRLYMVLDLSMYMTILLV